MATPRTTRGRFIATRNPSLSGVTVEGATEFNRAINGLADYIDDFTPTLELVVERGFYPIMAEIFETENRGRWEDLSPGYADWKQRNYGDKPIMQLTGSLMESLTSKDALYSVHHAQGKNAFVVGTRAPSRHAAIRRPVFQFSDADFGTFAEIASQDIEERAAALGFGDKKVLKPGRR